jgi:hypothetical protein
MNLDEAFTDTPPTLSDGVALRPFDSRVSQLVGKALDTISDQRDIVAVGAYVIAASLPPLDAVKILRAPDALDQFEATALQLTETDFGNVIDYLNRVIQRREAAAVEVAEQPGKSIPLPEIQPQT